MAKQGRPQLIEVIPIETPRLPAAPGGGHRPAAPGSSPPRRAGASDGDSRPPARRWWIAPAAVAAIAAVVVGVAVASDSPSNRRALPTLGSAPSSSPLTPPVLPLVPQTPTGYAIRSVTTTSADDSTAAPIVRELWATHSTAQTSSWLEITAGTHLALPAIGDSRIAVPAGIAVFQGQADGELTVTGPIPGGQATISSSAVSKATIAELFASMRLDDGVLVHSDPRLGGMFQEIGSDPPAGATPSQASAADGHGASLTVAYGAIDDTAQQRQDFDVTIGPVPAEFDETVRQFFLSRPSEVTVDGQQAVIGSDERTAETESVVFQRAGLEVSISGTAPRDVLLAALQSIHVATGTELAALMAVPSAGPVDSGAVPAHVWVSFATGNLSDGRPWTLRAGSTDGAISAIGLEAGDVSATATVEGRDGIILTLASPVETALVAYIPRDMPGARLVVIVGGAEHDAEAQDVGGGSLLAGVAFDQLTAYSAQIVGPDGRVLSSTSG
jgi:hypothetical protein